MEQHKFRRPAALSAQEAEAIVGGEDPAERSEVAHESAWALLGVTSEDIDQAGIARLLERVHTEGPEAVAGLWDISPAFTLPGALWRIYLLWQWNQLDPQVVQQRFAEGEATQPQPPKYSLEETLLGIGMVLSGGGTEKTIAGVCEAAAQTMRIMAAGVTHGPRWITEDGTELSHPVTRRSQALLDTAAELEQSAQQARLGRLD